MYVEVLVHLPRTTHVGRRSMFLHVIQFLFNAAKLESTVIEQCQSVSPGPQ